MPVWFVYRSPYHGPMSKYVKRLDGADTLLDWFRSVWRAIPDGDHGAEASAYAGRLLGTDVYSFGHLFVHAHDNALPPPETAGRLHAWLERALYVNEYRGTDDTIQVLSDDDELSLAMYWFTDAFAKAHPERVAYLLREDWRLPEAVGPGGFKPNRRLNLIGPRRRSRQGLYLVEQTWETASDLEDLDGCGKVVGLRLPDLVPWLLRHDVEDWEGLGNSGVLWSLRQDVETVLAAAEGVEASFRAALREQPDDRATWNAYTDWLADQGRPPAGQHLLERALQARGLSGHLLQVEPHCAAQMQSRDEGCTEFEQLFLFDDVWASGNVALANSLLDYHGRFNVLD
jgi:uncharacterized protein (TIGR02996 family)